MCVMSQESPADAKHPVSNTAEKSKKAREKRHKRWVFARGDVLSPLDATGVVCGREISGKNRDNVFSVSICCTSVSLKAL